MTIDLTASPVKITTFPSVSVVIPTHNRLHTLQRAVSSVLQQTYSIVELIVVDDGSTDDTSDWLRTQPANIRVITQENHGVSHARNRGIEHAQGDWIAFLDSDDYWHADKLQQQFDALQRSPELRLCHCDEIWIRNGKRVNPKNKHKKLGGNIFEHCLPLCAISPSATLIRSDAFTQHGLFDESLPACEDYDLWLRITACEPVCFVDKALLTKTGGHKDQLSARYAVMDRFRLQSLAKLLRGNTLTPQQRQMAHAVFTSKWQIVHNGALKHVNEQLIRMLTSDYPDLLDESLSDSAR